MISVVIPTCRRPDLLARCLGRLAPGVQTLQADRYEVIVTDDGLKTAEAVVQDQYPWAKWVAGPQKGPAANRNNGAQHARGEWIAFTDDDCVPDPGWLAGYAAAVAPGTDVYEGKTTCDAGIRSPLETAPVNLTGGYLWSCNIMVRAGLYRALGGFDEGFPYPHMEDVEFRERLDAVGHRPAFVPGALVDHPPRRVPFGWQLARSHESGVYWWYRTGKSKFVFPTLLFLTTRNRLRNLTRFRPSWDTVRGLVSFAVEMAHTLLLLPGWEWRYRRRFLPAKPPRPPQPDR